jgi:Transposase DDE domain
VKLHLLLDHNGHLPAFAVVTEGKKHEIQVARELAFTPGTTLVIDRGYTDYQWFVKLTQQKVHFVTRMKENADYGVVEKRELPNRRGVLRDEVIFFFKLAQAGMECFFRRIEFYDEEQERTLVFLSNNLV